MFRPRKQDFREAFSEFNKSLILIVDLDQLKDNVIGRIGELVPVGRIVIFLLNPDLDRFEAAEARGLDTGDYRNIVFFPDEPLVRWLTVNETHLAPSSVPEVIEYLSPREREALAAMQVDLVFPLMVMNRVTGLVCMGPRRDGRPFGPDEVDILRTFLAQAAFAFENACLYREQKTRLRKMYRADRLATLGQLAAGAAHEIRNPLTAIRSTIQYIRRDIGDESKRELVNDVLDEVDRIDGIIKGLLTFSKPEAPAVETTDLRHLLDQTVNLASVTAMKKDITVTLDYQAVETAITADPSQLKQVFLNIVMNALQSMDGGGSLVVRISLGQALHTVGTGHSRYIITFSDTGEGIAPDNMEHVFDPFFTTKKDGTGLGLSISYGIIRQHDGDIEIESRTPAENPGQHGTTVTVTLPAGTDTRTSRRS